MNYSTDIKATAIATVALVIAIAAAAIAWVAYDRTGDLMDEAAGSSLNTTTPELDESSEIVPPSGSGNTDATTVPQSQP